ncbi:hypothetical protein A8B98_00310 [Hymenobacter sp. UV11]|nr:hypothetical protein A8B98_00310 [Hymenobacter sp. UV11]
MANTQQKLLWQLAVHQLADVMILVLLAAAGVSVLIGEAKSAYVILAIVVLNGFSAADASGPWGRLRWLPLRPKYR